ncbi:SDR family oxidoreductase [Nocardioides rubriscoriae]|uniref:SDR family oxidoreductase n=1 Tax=Nocardioides rubriscoriae TaxID=642762 RepID=UPI0011DF60CC|nr:SDR family oxidoreductase [Nocardioides rubriscoriae]
MPTHLVTGAGSGIGRSVADRLHARGDDLVLIARSEDRADALRARWPGATTIVCDLVAPVLVDDTTGALPDRLDSVIMSAGVVDLAPVADLGLGSLSAQLNVNLVSPMVLTRLLLPAVRRARGLFVYVNSSAGLSASADWSAYAASKFGLRAFADSLRAEEVDHGVRVTSVFPSRTATPMQERVHAQEGRTYDASRWISPDTVADTILHVLDLPGDATIPEVTVRPVVPRAT